MPTTAPVISTKTSTRLIPFFRSAFSPKKCPALKRKPTKKITPSKMGNIDRMVSEISATESSIPPICAEALRLKKRLNSRLLGKMPLEINFFMNKSFRLNKKSVNVF